MEKELMVLAPASNGGSLCTKPAAMAKFCSGTVRCLQPQSLSFGPIPACDTRVDYGLIDELTGTRMRSEKSDGKSGGDDGARGEKQLPDVVQKSSVLF